MNGVAAAVSVLTRWPVHRAVRAEDVGYSTPYFPVVGAAIGGVQVLVLWALSASVPGLPPVLMAVVLVTTALWITRGIHLDGLVDVADSLGGRSREDALRIMRDLNLGT